MSFTEEKNFLTQFMDSAMTGLITTVTKIKRAYEAQIGRKVHQTTIIRHKLRLCTICQLLGNILLLSVKALANSGF